MSITILSFQNRHHAHRWKEDDRMATYKDEKRGTWYCKFYYVDWTGTRRQKLKRGFKLQREAKEWERLFLEQFAKNPDITFEALYEKYKEYIKPRIRESTAHGRRTY